MIDDDIEDNRIKLEQFFPFVLEEGELFFDQSIKKWTYKRDGLTYWLHYRPYKNKETWWPHRGKDVPINDNNRTGYIFRTAVQVSVANKNNIVYELC